MKTKILTLSIFSFFLFLSCDKEDTASSINATDVESNASIDNVADDVLQIVESQSDETSVAGRMSAISEKFLNDCATITTVKTANNWTRTIDFGDTNCTIRNENRVRGKIIINFSADFTANTRNITYTFENFYHNDRLIEGGRTVVKTILSNGHPQATINLNMKVTTTNGDVYTRVGTRVREFTEGYTTPNILADNVFSVTGSWTTTLPSGIEHSATIVSPLIIKWSCPHIVSGSISFVKKNVTALLDYGNGDCDAKATITINGVVRNIIL